MRCFGADEEPQEPEEWKNSGSSTQVCSRSSSEAWVDPAIPCVAAVIRQTLGFARVSFFN